MMLTTLLVLALGQDRIYTFCPEGNVSNPSTCTLHGDPVDLNYGNYVLTRDDGPAGGREPRLLRYFSSSDNTWVYGEKVDNRPVGSVRGMPKPFGESTAGLAMHWWHNWYSFVEVQGGGRRGSTLYVRQPGGRTTRWALPRCDGTWVRAGGHEYNHSENLKVRCLSAGGFDVVLEDGAVLGYRAPVQTSMADVTRYFLTTKTTPTSTIDVTYAQPLAATGGLLTACPRPDATNWVPYVSRVRERETGATLAFRYADVRHQGETRCPLRLVLHGQTPQVLPGGTLTPLVEYSAAPTGHAVAAPGRWLAEVRLWRVRYAHAPPEAWREAERYSYTTDAASRCTANASSGRCPMVPHFVVSSPRAVETRVELDTRGTTATRVSNSVQDISYRHGSPTRTEAEVLHRTSLSANHAITVQSVWGRKLSVGTHSGRLAEVTWDGGTYAFPRGNPSWEWGDLSTTGTYVSSTSSAGRRTVTTLEESADTSGGAYLTSVHRGMATGVSPKTPPALNVAGNCGGLECEWWTNETAPTGAVRPNSHSQRSTLAPGELTTTQYRYHPNGLLAASIQKGWTLGVSGGVVPRYVGTFYRTTRQTGGSCLGGSDTQGRIVEVEGPCDVAGFAADTCSDGAGRLVQYAYHPTNATTSTLEGGL